MKAYKIITAIVCIYVCIACRNSINPPLPPSKLENYRPMLVEGYQWNTVLAAFPAGTMMYQTSVFEIKGDSTINRQPYKKVWISYQEDKSNALLYGLVREDVPQQKIYLYLNGKDVLLYDFAMRVGDTTKLYLCDFYHENTDYEYYLQLASITNEQDQEGKLYREFHYDIYMKFQHATEGSYMYTFEKIGGHTTRERFGSSTQGLIPNNMSGLEGDCACDVLCIYDETGNVVFTNDYAEAPYTGYCFFTEKVE